MPFEGLSLTFGEGPNPSLDYEDRKIDLTNRYDPLNKQFCGVSNNVLIWLVAICTLPVRAERILSRWGLEKIFNLGEDLNQFFPNIIIVFSKIPKI